jgi:cytochrome b subunit of formate dehydrogenase
MMIVSRIVIIIAGLIIWTSERMFIISMQIKAENVIVSMLKYESSNAYKATNIIMAA